MKWKLSIIVVTILYIVGTCKGAYQPELMHASCTENYIGTPSCNLDKNLCGYESSSNDKLSWERMEEVKLFPRGTLNDWQPSGSTKTKRGFAYLDVKNGVSGSKARLSHPIQSGVNAVCIEVYYATHIIKGQNISTITVYNELKDGTDVHIGEIQDDTKGQWKIARFHSCVGKMSKIAFESAKIDRFTVVALDYIKITQSNMNCPNPTVETTNATDEPYDMTTTDEPYAMTTTDESYDMTTTDEIENTTTDAIEDTTTDEFENTTTDEIEDTTTDEIIEDTTTDEIENTTIDEIENTTTDAIEDTTTDEIENTTTDEIEDTTTDEIEGNTTDEIEDTTAHEIENTTTDEIEDTTTDEIEENTTDEIEDTTKDEIEDTTTDEIENTTIDEIEDTTTDEIEDTTTDEIEDTTTDEIEDTTTDDIEDTTIDEIEDTTTDEPNSTPTAPSDNIKLTTRTTTTVHTFYSLTTTTTTTTTEMISQSTDLKGSFGAPKVDSHSTCVNITHRPSSLQFEPQMNDSFSELTWSSCNDTDVGEYFYFNASDASQEDEILGTATVVIDERKGDDLVSMEIFFRCKLNGGLNLEVILGNDSLLLQTDGSTGDSWTNHTIKLSSSNVTNNELMFKVWKEASNDTMDDGEGEPEFYLADIQTIAITKRTEIDGLNFTISTLTPFLIPPPTPFNPLVTVKNLLDCPSKNIASTSCLNAMTFDPPRIQNNVTSTWSLQKDNDGVYVSCNVSKASQMKSVLSLEKSTFHVDELTEMEIKFRYKLSQGLQVDLMYQNVDVWNSNQSNTTSSNGWRWETVSVSNADLKSKTLSTRHKRAAPAPAKTTHGPKISFVVSKLDNTSTGEFQLGDLKVDSLVSVKFDIPDDDDDEYSTGTIVAVCVPSVLIVLIIVGVLACQIQRKRKASKYAEDEDDEVEEMAYASSNKNGDPNPRKFGVDNNVYYQGSTYDTILDGMDTINKQRPVEKTSF